VIFCFALSLGADRVTIEKTMSIYDFEFNSVQLDLFSERRLVENFLSTRQLKLDPDVEYTCVLKTGGKIVGTGSLAGNVLKCIAVDAAYQGETLTNKIVTELELEAYHRGIEHLFLFTKSENRTVFQSLGFGLVASAGTLTAGTPAGGNTSAGAAETAGVVLLEKPEGQIDLWLKEPAASASCRGEGADLATTGPAADSAAPGPSTALVMNCNPFTLGHRYLVEQAALRAARQPSRQGEVPGGLRGDPTPGETPGEEGHVVHLFVVSAERSLFPEEVRFRLVQQGTEDLKNVIVHHGGPYIISGATFPSYFLRDSKEVTTAHARLDLQIFGEKIAPALNIRRRMVGEEPYCPVTAAYNREMQHILPHYGIEVEEIPRLLHGGAAISASKVRELIREEKWEEIEHLVPASTWNYLTSAEATAVIERIRREKRRH